MNITITLSVADWQKVKTALLAKSFQEGEAAINIGVINTVGKDYARLYEYVDSKLTEQYLTHEHPTKTQV